jgi:Na+-driven multidrug efflux pump
MFFSSMRCVGQRQVHPCKKRLEPCNCYHMLLLRRFLVLIALFFWQGGFTFYASVVVPVGQQVFGHLGQGFITRQVTVYLNLAGSVALVVLVWDQFAARDPARWRRASRWLLWAGMVFTLLWLFWLHGQLNDLLVVKGRIIRDPDLFRARHRLYLWISTVQWAWGLLYLFLTLVTWRKEDRLIDTASGMKQSATVG